MRIVYLARFGVEHMQLDQSVVTEAAGVHRLELIAFCL